MGLEDSHFQIIVQKVKANTYCIGISSSASSSSLPSATHLPIPASFMYKQFLASKFFSNSVTKVNGTWFMAVD